MYAFLDDGPFAQESVRVEPGPDGRPPVTIELADTDGSLACYQLIGPHHNDEWWIYRRARPG